MRKKKLGGKRIGAGRKFSIGGPTSPAPFRMYDSDISSAREKISQSQVTAADWFKRIINNPT